MATQRELATQQFSFMPTTLKEAQEYATIFANSGLCPEGYRGRPNDILIVWQLGRELGLDKMQSLRTLGCVNGMPFAYGDGQLALIKKHRDFEWLKEWFEGEMSKNTFIAYCTMKRRGEEPVTREFSMEDAKLAGLWNKKGVWQQYPKRMLQHRARGFCAKDTFPDALYGLKSEDEVHDIVDAQVVVEVPKPVSKGMAGLEEALGIEDVEPVEVQPVVEGEVIKANPKLEELKELIARLNVTKGSITVTLKKFDAETLEQLTDEQIDKWSSHLKTKESKDAI